MGVFATGPSATSIDVAGIAAAMRPTLYEWFTGRVVVFDPKRGTINDYNPEADTGGVATEAIVFDSLANGALIQPIRSPGRIEVGGQGNGLLGIRFQVKRLEPETGQTLRGGLQVRVLDGGESPDLIGLTFGLMESIDSSLAWGRIWDAVVLTGG